MDRLYFFFLWSICWSFIVCFKNGTCTLQREKARVFIALRKFVLYSLVWSSFLFSEDTYKFLFFWVFWFLFDFLALFLPSLVVFGFYLLSWHIFLGKIPHLYPNCLFSLLVLGFPVIFHLFTLLEFFTGVWVTVSLLKSQGFFSVFWPSSIMLSFGWSSLVHQLPNPPGPLIILQSLCQGTSQNWYNRNLHVP